MGVTTAAREISSLVGSQVASVSFNAFTRGRVPQNNSQKADFEFLGFFKIENLLYYSLLAGALSIWLDSRLYWFKLSTYLELLEL